MGATRDPAIYQIDPTAMGENDALILAHFLRERSSNSYFRPVFFAANVEYSFSKGGDEIIKSLNNQLPIRVLILSNSLSLRPCSSNSNDTHYDVHNKLINQGTYAKVFEVIGVLKLDEKQGTVFIKKERVAKLNFSVEKKDQSRIIRKRELREHFVSAAHTEFLLTKRVESLNIKRPVTVGDGHNYGNIFPITEEAGNSTKHKITSYPRLENILIMRRVTGENLYRHIEKDFADAQKNLNFIPTKARIELAFILISKLEQIHRHNVLHCDIKPENIIVDFATSPPTVTFVDYGLSCDVHKKHNMLVGTPVYFAPELAGKDFTRNSDYFSLACVLSRIFRADYNPAKDMNDIWRIASNRTFTNLFNGITDLKDKNLSFLIHKMASRIPEERTSLDLLAEFATLRLDVLKMSELPVMSKAHEAWKALRVALPLYLTQKSPGEVSINDIEKAFLAALHSIEDSPAVMSEFVFVLNVDTFRGLTTRADLTAKFDQAIKTYPQNLKKFKGLRDQITVILEKGGEEGKFTDQMKNELSRIRNQLETIYNRNLIRKEFVPLDTLALYNQKLDTYYAKLSPVVEKYGQQLESSQPLPSFPSPRMG